jgi:large subunit ribosomal protein L9
MELSEGTMQVILKEDVPKLGRAGQVVNVKDGYGRNYLIPQNLAVLATPKNVKQFDHQKRIVSSRVEKLRKAAATVAERLAGYACTISRNCGDNDKLFGSVSPKDIATTLNDEGIDVARRQIDLAKPVKQLGIYPVDVRLHADIRCRIMVWVIAKG